MQIIPSFKGMPLIIDGNAYKAFEITDAVSMRAFVTATCHSLRSKGRNQRYCSGFFTEWYREQFPLHNFTNTKKNPPQQNKIYNNIRKAISDYWKQYRILEEDID